MGPVVSSLGDRNGWRHPRSVDPDLALEPRCRYANRLPALLAREFFLVRPGLRNVFPCLTARLADWQRATHAYMQGVAEGETPAPLPAT